MLNYRLNKYLEEYGLLGEEQAGFRSGYSTSDHFFAMDVLDNLYLYSGKNLYCAFVDNKKTFDSIDRVFMWQKLMSNNIGDKFLQVIYNIYKDAKSKIKTHDGLSANFFKCNIGVRQGENISHVLFAMYLDDIQEFISKRYYCLTYHSKVSKELLSDEDVELFFKLYLYLYADDTIVLAESPNELQKVLDDMDAYCSS